MVSWPSRNPNGVSEHRLYEEKGMGVGEITERSIVFVRIRSSFQVTTLSKGRSSSNNGSREMKPSTDPLIYIRSFQSSVDP